MADLNIATTGAVAGEFTADLAAARKLAKDTGKNFLILFCRSTGCAYCNKAKAAIWTKPEFTDWCKAQGMSIVYADRVDTKAQPGKEVKSTYPKLSLYPALILVKGSDGKTAIGTAVIRSGKTADGIKLKCDVATTVEWIEKICPDCCDGCGDAVQYCPTCGQALPAK